MKSSRTFKILMLLLLVTPLIFLLGLPARAADQETVTIRDISESQLITDLGSHNFTWFMHRIPYLNTLGITGYDFNLVDQKLAIGKTGTLKYHSDGGIEFFESYTPTTKDRVVEALFSEKADFYATKAFYAIDSPIDKCKTIRVNLNSDKSETLSAKWLQACVNTSRDIKIDGPKHTIQEKRENYPWPRLDIGKLIDLEVFYGTAYYNYVGVTTPTALPYLMAPGLFFYNSFKIDDERILDLLVLENRVGYTIKRLKVPDGMNFLNVQLKDGSILSYRLSFEYLGSIYPDGLKFDMTTREPLVLTLTPTTTPTPTLSPTLTNTPQPTQTPSPTATESHVPAAVAVVPPGSNTGTGSETLPQAEVNLPNVSVSAPPEDGQGLAWFDSLKTGPILVVGAAVGVVLLMLLLLAVLRNSARRTTHV